VRCVFDTNVIVSALLSENGKPAQAFQYALKNGKILLSRDSLKELNEVLGRKKFDRYITSERRKDFLRTFVSLAVLVEIVETVAECRDSKDNKFLELAINGNAQYIVSGDEDLLVLHPCRTVNIVTVEQFLRMINLND
jgi:putative PIN family toxin of toxin-antitoxin system